MFNKELGVGKVAGKVNDADLVTKVQPTPAAARFREERKGGMQGSDVNRIPNSAIPAFAPVKLPRRSNGAMWRRGCRNHALHVTYTPQPSGREKRERSAKDSSHFLQKLPRRPKGGEGSFLEETLAPMSWFLDF